MPGTRHTGSLYRAHGGWLTPVSGRQGPPRAAAVRRPARSPSRPLLARWAWRFLEVSPAGGTAMLGSGGDDRRRRGRHDRCRGSTLDVGDGATDRLGGPVAPRDERALSSQPLPRLVGEHLRQGLGGVEQGGDRPIDVVRRRALGQHGAHPVEYRLAGRLVDDPPARRRDDSEGAVLVTPDDPVGHEDPRHLVPERAGTVGPARRPTHPRDGVLRLLAVGPAHDLFPAWPGQ